MTNYVDEFVLNQAFDYIKENCLEDVEYSDVVEYIDYKEVDISYDMFYEYVSLAQRFLRDIIDGGGVRKIIKLGIQANNALINRRDGENE